MFLSLHCSAKTAVVAFLADWKTSKSYGISWLQATSTTSGRACEPKSTSIARTIAIVANPKPNAEVE
jgi:hypothetical protein